MLRLNYGMNYFMLVLDDFKRWLLKCLLGWLLRLLMSYLLMTDIEIHTSIFDRFQSKYSNTVYYIFILTFEGGERQILRRLNCRVNAPLLEQSCFLQWTQSKGFRSAFFHPTKIHPDFFGQHFVFFQKLENF